jgi:hypothetical protein
VQRVQQSFGKQSVEILLLSVDEGYGIDGERDKKLLAARGIDWPNVLLPGGWAEVMKVFNCSGYGLLVVDGTGTVRGVNVYRSQLAPLISQLWVEESARRAGKPVPAAADDPDRR